MAIKPYSCKTHGETTAYFYIVKQGPNKGKAIITCRDCRKIEIKTEWLKVKSNLIKAYGGKCSCCGEAEPGFLTLDHTNGDGNKHRKQGLRGWRLYQYLAKKGYPKNGYQILCYNCNCSKGQFGKCPHQVQA